MGIVRGKLCEVSGEQQIPHTIRATRGWVPFLRQGRRDDNVKAKDASNARGLFDYAHFTRKRQAAELRKAKLCATETKLLASSPNRGRSGRAGSGFRRGPGFEELFFAINHGVDVIRSELEAMPVSDGVGGASFDAIAAKNAAGIIDVVDLGVTVGVGDAIVGGVFGGFDVNAIRGTRGGAKKTGDAFFEAVLVALQHVDSAIARLKMDGLGGIILRGGLLPHGDERHLEALVENDESAEEFFNDRCHKHLL